METGTNQFLSPQDDLDSIQLKIIFFSKKNFFSSIHASSDLGWGFACPAMVKLSPVCVDTASPAHQQTLAYMGWEHKHIHRGIRISSYHQHSA